MDRLAHFASRLCLVVLAAGAFHTAQAALNADDAAPRLHKFRSAGRQGLSLLACRGAGEGPGGRLSLPLSRFGFDAVMQTRTDFADRLSFEIARDRKVAYYNQKLNPDRHVERMLTALGTMAKAPAR